MGVRESKQSQGWIETQRVGVVGGWVGESDHGRGSEAGGRDGVNLTSLSPNLFQNIINTLS